MFLQFEEKYSEISVDKYVSAKLLQRCVTSKESIVIEYDDRM